MGGGLLAAARKALYAQLYIKARSFFSKFCGGSLNGVQHRSFWPSGLYYRASSGLGAQFARTLAAAGAAVVLASRRVDKLKALRAEIDGAGATRMSLNWMSTTPIRSSPAVAHARNGSRFRDILINNSGVSTTQRLQDVTPEDFDYVFQHQRQGAFFVAQEVGKRMLARAQGCAGHVHRGRIINIASMAGLRVLPQMVFTA